ncbi:hypothetical protein SESBI_29167 [Sesbania bispinosa]|nr:hypothetical protein SESBI_29167 [Sesbania bispinosa]
MQNGSHNSNIAPWGKLLRNEQNVLEYVGGEVDVWEELDCDLLNSSVEIIDVEVVAKDPDEEEYVESRAEVVVEEPVEEDEEIYAEVVVEKPVEEDEDILTDVVVDEGLEEDSVSNVHSDSYESAEDSIYRPSPIVSIDDEEVTPIVAEIRSKKKKMMFVLQKRGRMLLKLQRKEVAVREGL